MGASGSKRFDRDKEELLKLIDLGCHRAKLLRKRLENELARTYQAINSNGTDVNIKGEQCLYQESCLHVIDYLVKDLNLLKTRQHLFGPVIDGQLMPCIATVMHCAGRLDVPELGAITKLLRHMYGKDLTPVPNQELLNKLNPRQPTEEEVKRHVDKVIQLFRSKARIKPAAERTSATGGKRTELDDLLERIQILRS